MIVKDIRLINFRNYNSIGVEFNKNVNVFVGKNAQGKSNLLESIYMSATGKSFRTNRDKEIINFQKKEAYIGANIIVGKFDKFKALSLFIYIGMGWIAIIPIKAIINATSIHFFYWIMAGGLLYTVGTIFYGVKKIPYNHAICHLFVLEASVTHFLGIVFYLA